MKALDHCDSSDDSAGRAFLNPGSGITRRPRIPLRRHQPYHAKNRRRYYYLCQNSIWMFAAYLFLTKLHLIAPSIVMMAIVAPMENHVHQGIEHAAKLGAECAYVVPPKPKDQDMLPILSQRYRQLAELGQSQGLKMAIEHFPGTVLPTVKATLSSSTSTTPIFTCSSISGMPR